MALTKGNQAVLASQSVSAGGGGLTSSAFTVLYGVAGSVIVTNGATAPTVAGDVIEQLSFDGGTTWTEWNRRTPGLVNSGVYNFPFAYGVAGLAGDASHYRIVINAPTTTAVTAACSASQTSAF